MECRHCRRRWQMETPVQFCPFCGKSLPAQSPPDSAPAEPRSEREALRYVVARFGKETLRDGFHVSAMLNDLIPAMRRERTILRTALSLDVVRMLLDADPRGLDVREDAMARAYRLLIDEAGMNESAAYCAVTAFGYALEWPLIDGDSLREEGFMGGAGGAFSGGAPAPFASGEAAPFAPARHPRARRASQRLNEFTAEDAKRLFEDKEIAHVPPVVQRVGDRAFWRMTKLTTVALPDGVREIGERAFSGCDALINVRLPDSLEDVGDYAFHCCAALTAFSLPAGVRRVGDSAFLGCAELERVTLFEGLREIGAFAFAYCGKLTEVSIPASVADIGMLAFDSATKLVCAPGSYALRYAQEAGLSYRVR